MLPSNIIHCLLAFATAGTAAPQHTWADDEGGSNGLPTVQTKNGTYSGVHSPGYQQDFFLGMPFAQPPVGDLRFSNPVPLNSSWDGTIEATSYAPACVGYGPSQIGYEVSEDCLYLNVIRPSNIEGPLPVAVWIFGGGFVQGSGSDLRYNMSFIVNRSVDIEQPIMAVTLNYRLSAWGFLNSDEVASSGNSNFGIRDQRLALHWIQENIAAFGGDPSKVTIWGQSAGAASVGMHLLAYNGRDDGLFRSAIMESGGPLALSGQTSSTQEAYNNLTLATKCSTTTDTLACLRSMPYQELNSAINTTSLSGAWGPKIDNDLIATHSSEQLVSGAFVHVPIIIGANSDEGTSSAPKGIDNDTAFLGSLSSLPTDFAEQIADAYPNDPSLPLALASLPADFVPNATYGAQYRRAATYAGDRTFIAGRRLSAQTWSAAGVPVWSFRFNAIPAWAGMMDGVTHFVEVAFAMFNVDGVGYEPARVPPFEGKGVEYARLAEVMSADWAAFVATGEPRWERREIYGVPEWEAYGGGREGVNFVYDANVTSYLEGDTWRREGIESILGASLEVYDR